MEEKKRNDKLKEDAKRKWDDVLQFYYEKDDIETFIKRKDRMNELFPVSKDDELEIEGEWKARIEEYQLQ